MGVCVRVCVYGCVWLCVFVCVCGWGGSQCPPGCNSPDGPSWACSEVFLPHGDDGVSWHLLPRAPWGTLHLSHGHYFFLAFVSPFCFSDVPRAGEGPGSHWSLVLPYISANGKLALFPFCSLSVVTFKGLSVSSGTSFHRCGQNLGVGTLFLSPERLC